MRLPHFSENNELVGEKQKWSFLRDNFRAMIKEEESAAELNTGKGSQDDKNRMVNTARGMLVELEELRRLRLARAITFVGVEAAMNNRPPPRAMMRDQNVEKIAEYLGRMHGIERRLDDEYRERVEGELSTQQVMRLVLPEWWEAAFPMNSPITTFGPLRVVGNTDSENYSSIRNLLSLHLAKERAKPLSIAVFGSPGSGKSFGIKAIAKAIAGDSVEVYTCNLAQLSDREDLNREFFNAFQILLRGKTPLIFFDEFDSHTKFGGKNGWLKYFLEPMQDGHFRHMHGVVELRNSILVFAGGTAETYGEFVTGMGSEDSKAEECRQQKLPDFVSRLHGFIDVPGLNEGQDTAHAGIPYIRRALVLRTSIEQDERLMDANGIACIDRNVVDAFLRVNRYSHGARSLGAILGMCMRWNNRIEKSSVPSRTQLNIHTDGDQFHKLVNRPKFESPLAK